VSTFSNRLSITSKEVGHTGGAGKGPNGSHHCENPDMEITDQFEASKSILHDTTFSNRASLLNMKRWQVVPDHQQARPYQFERAANRHAQNKVSLFGGAKNSQHLGIKGSSEHPANPCFPGSVVATSGNSYLEPGTHTHALIESMRASKEKLLSPTSNNVTIKEQRLPPSGQEQYALTSHLSSPQGEDPGSDNIFGSQNASPNGKRDYVRVYN